MSQQSSPSSSPAAAPQGTAKSPTYRSILAVPEFRVMFLAQIVATLGNATTQITLSVVVYERTRSPLLSSLTFALGFAPYLFGATFLSAVADRYSSRDVLVVCQVVSCAAVGLMAVPSAPIPVLLLLLLVLGTVAPVFQGARAASLPDLLSGAGYVLGRSLLRLVSQSTQIIGFAAGGVLLIVLTSTQALLLASVGFGVAALMLRFGTRRLPARQGPDRSSVTRSSLSGVRQVFAVPGLRPLLLFTWLPPTLVVAPEALAATYADRLGGGSTATGLLLGAAPAGSVIGEILAGTLLRPGARVRLVLPLGCLMFVPLLFFVFAPGLVPATLLLVVCGLGFTYAMGLDQRVLDATPGELRGRALTITMAGLMIGQGVGFAAAGATAEFLPAHLVVAGAGVLGLAGVVVCGVRLSPHGRTGRFSTGNTDAPAERSPS
ncbi:MFS transporter [Streptomyces sp. NEAU-W12]|uniref:MFS transporter n=1 Tax=Streptomyces sp. NEAU-W12 TaxID=2994668 RepID=UPI00224B70A4|nr:MFS transporter [Streptomyces sp. NEAU-W12]MCX2925263.1 MFS transporter [Streptomyces sp. NEAU-W12]